MKRAKPDSIPAFYAHHKDRPLHLRLKAMRIGRQWTLPDLSKKSGVSKGLLSKLETDRKSNPTLATLKAIAKAHGTTLSQLLSGL